MLAIAFCVLACSDTRSAPMASELPNTDSLEGAWRLVERRLPGPQGTINVRPQPGIRLFVDGHSCLVRVDATEPRPVLVEDSATAPDLVAAWRPFVAQCGTYVVTGERITERYFVSKSPGGMTGDVVNTQSYRMSGDTLWLSTIEAGAVAVPFPGYSKFVRAR
jgi:hypothetical protein